MKRFSVSVPDELYDKLFNLALEWSKAERRQISISEVVRRLLAKAVQ